MFCEHGGGEWRAVISDFGFAIQVSHQRLKGALYGTAQFASPEVYNYLHFLRSLVESKWASLLSNQKFYSSIFGQESPEKCSNCLQTKIRL